MNISEIGGLITNFEHYHTWFYDFQNLEIGIPCRRRNPSFFLRLLGWCSLFRYLASFYPFLEMIAFSYSDPKLGFLRFPEKSLYLNISG